MNERHALLIGNSDGIGAQTTQRLLDEGYRVTGMYFHFTPSMALHWIPRDEKFVGMKLELIPPAKEHAKFFSETKIRKLIALVHEMNLPSCRLIEKVGFQREGLLREHYLVDGQPANEVIYGLLRSEFQKSLP